ncbi:MAG: acyltransferase, partial [Pseudomonadota bacterium]
SRRLFTQPVRMRDGHDNFFTPLRLIFALMVMIGHSFVIAGGGSDYEPMLFLHYSPSYLAVNLFFIASGFLVTGSMLYRGDAASYAGSRLLRIYPGLIVHVLFVMLVIGLIATTLTPIRYLLHPDVLSQPLRVLSFVNTDMILPGVFTENGEQLASAPLWTLRFEMLCYVGTLLAFSLGLMRRKWMLLAQFVIPSIIWMIGQGADLFAALPGSVENMVRFGMAYGLGAAIYAYRDRLCSALWMIPVLATLCWALRQTDAVDIAMNMMLASGLFYAAFIRIPALNQLKSLPDMSYGIYIYHWSILQLAIVFWPSLTGPALLLISLPVVMGLAWLSWTYVEAPLLRRKDRFGDWLRFGRQRSPAKHKTVLLD